MLPREPRIRVVSISEMNFEFSIDITERIGSSFETNKRPACCEIVIAISDAVAVAIAISEESSFSSIFGLCQFEMNPSVVLEVRDRHGAAR